MEKTCTEISLVCTLAKLCFKGLVITIGMLESMWVFTTVERVNFTPNLLRTILFAYDF